MPHIGDSRPGPDGVLDVFRHDGPGGGEPAQRTDVRALVQSLVDDAAELDQPVVFTAGDDAAVRVDAGTVKIVVDDAGPGIPPVDLESVFQPFFRVEASRNRQTGGTGLGLYIARDLTQRQGGTLTLHNRAAGGLRAEVTLPGEASAMSAG